MLTSTDIIKARNYLGEPQGSFAKRFGVTQPTICRWEKNGVPTDRMTQLAIERVLETIQVQEAAE